jgi:uncharacterized protein YbjT (DUF2867 family)
MAGRLVTVFGGSGFLGRSVVKRLTEAGDRVRVAVRNPNSALNLKTMGSVGQVQVVQANVRYRDSVRAAVHGADAVINLVGVLYESGHQSFEEIHAKGAGTVAAAAAEAGVAQLIQMSALGADPKSSSTYATTKAAGEDAVRAAFPAATVLRPSVVFGPDDGFLNRFADLCTKLPVLPVIGGKTRFQPIYVGDVADAILAILNRPESAGQTYELGGPRVYSLRDIMAYVCKETGRDRALVTVPMFVARIQAAILGLLPKPMLTSDQLRLLGTDNVVSATAPGLHELGVTPTSLEAIAPTYLTRYRVLGEFAATDAG